MDLLGKADPYVCLWTRETRKMHTAVRSYTLHPVWQVWRMGQPTPSLRPCMRRRLPIAALLLSASPGELVSRGAQAFSIAATCRKLTPSRGPCVQETFTFLVHSREHQSLHLELYDSGAAVVRL